MSSVQPLDTLLAREDVCRAQGGVYLVSKAQLRQQSFREKIASTKRVFSRSQCPTDNHHSVPTPRSFVVPIPSDMNCFCDSILRPFLCLHGSIGSSELLLTPKDTSILPSLLACEEGIPCCSHCGPLPNAWEKADRCQLDLLPEQPFQPLAETCF